MTEEKFREIYRQYYQIVKKVVYSILRDIDFAEDVSQEVFISFLKRADTLQEEYHKQWLIVNAKRKAIDFCRKSYQVHEVTAGYSNEEELFAEEGIMWTSNRSEKQSSVEEETTKKLVMQEFTGKLFEDLEKKNSQWYEIVMKMNVEGKGVLETARALGISVENLRAKRHRIKAWINKYYRNKFEDL